LKAREAHQKAQSKLHFYTTRHRNVFDMAAGQSFPDGGFRYDFRKPVFHCKLSKEKYATANEARIRAEELHGEEARKWKLLGSGRYWAFYVLE
jgi:hypothetical protein